MKGLFIYSYDWYEWEDLICVSNSETKLIEKFTEVAGDGQELVTCESHHSVLRDKEERHYMIKDVEVL